MNQPLRLTTQQAGDLLQVSADQVLAYVRAGRLIARREGARRLYFLPRDVEAFCEAMPVWSADVPDDGAVTPIKRRRGVKRVG